MENLDLRFAKPVKTDEDELNVREIIEVLWLKRWIILALSIVGLALAAVYAYGFAKPVFESSALLLPTQAPSTDQLGQAAALLGRKSGGSGDVDLYQSLLTSRSVIHKLMQASLRDESESGKGSEVPLFRILKVDTTNPVAAEECVKSLAKSIKVGSKESGAGGILEIKFEAGAPWLAQQIGNTVLAIGQDELRLIRIERSELILTRLGVVVNQAKAEWETSAKELSQYKDRNRSIALPNQILEISRLEIERQAKEQKYMLVRKEYDLQMLERAKATPPMMILDPADLPAHKSKPARTMMLALGLMMGVSAGIIVVFAQKFLSTPKQEN